MQKEEVEPNFVSLNDRHSQTNANIKKEEVTIEDLHSDLEKKLHEQGFTFDKRKFIFEDKHLSWGERIADRVATFGGSWKFIILFGIFIFIWITVNAAFLLNEGFDPYPFILMNLILSCVASLQAPIIMMSQNRQSMREKHQEEINLEKDIVDFKQDRLDLILDQKEWEILKGMDERLRRIEKKLGAGPKKARKKK